MTDPIDRVTWVDAATLTANHYNPNHVAQAEFSLLERSLLLTGWVQPLLVTPKGEIIDGFHRWKLSSHSPAVRAKYGGRVPVAVLDIPEADAMLLTVRINRAKGTHGGLKMGDLVRALVDTHGLDRKRIASEMGASTEEVDLLYKGTVFKVRDTAHHKYSRSWTPAENGKQRLGDEGRRPAPERLP